MNFSANSKEPQKSKVNTELSAKKLNCVYFSGARLKKKFWMLKQAGTANLFSTNQHLQHANQLLHREKCEFTATNVNLQLQLALLTANWYFFLSLLTSYL